MKRAGLVFSCLGGHSAVGPVPVVVGDSREGSLSHCQSMGKGLGIKLSGILGCIDTNGTYKIHFIPCKELKLSKNN
jgi:hypothetical protein